MRKSKIALVDCDGVLADFAGSILRVIGKEDAKINQWSFFDQWGPTYRRLIMSMMRDGGFWKKLSPLPGAKEFVNLLKKEGYRVVCVTTPWESCRSWEFIRRRWVREYMGIPPEDLVYVRDKSLVTGDFLVEDKYENALKYARTTGKYSYLVTHDYNANIVLEHEKIIRVESYKEILKHVKDNDDLEYYK